MNRFNFKLTKVNDWDNFLSCDDRVCITLMEDLINGFIFNKIAIVTELDLYKNTSRSFTAKSRLSPVDTIFKDLAKINIDDLVVHEEHGIGIYKGLIDIDLGHGLEQFMLLEYQDNAKLYVPVSKIFLVTRYLGQDKENIVLNKLGRGNWLKLKQKVLYKSYDIACLLYTSPSPRDA